MTRKIFAPLVILATATTLFFATTAVAKRPDPAVSVNPSPTNVGNNLVFSGCGYDAASSVSVVVVSPYAMSFSRANTDVNGCFSTSGWGYMALSTGSYTVNIYQATDHRNPSGTLTFTVR